MRRGPVVRKATAAVAACSRALLLGSCAVALAAGGAWATAEHAFPYVTSHDYFRLRSIRVTSDETRVAPQVLAELGGLYDDTSLWNVDPEAVAAQLREMSWVREVRVARRFPWQVSLTVLRRHAVAATLADGEAWLVDDEGVLFREIGGTSAPDLPYLTGWEQPEVQAERAARLRNLLAALDLATERGIEVSELHMDDDGTVHLFASELQAAVRLGEPSHVATGLDRLALALAELGPLAEQARVIDTDLGDRIVVRGADHRLPALLAKRDPASAPSTNPSASSGSAATVSTPSAGPGATVSPSPGASPAGRHHG
jgi:cell division septal protein FtsQ